MNNDNNVQNEDSTSSSSENVPDLSKEAAQQLSELAKPKSYGTMRMVSAKDYTSDPDKEILHG